MQIIRALNIIRIVNFKRATLLAVIFKPVSSLLVFGFTALIPNLFAPRMVHAESSASGGAAQAASIEDKKESNGSDEKTDSSKGNSDSTKADQKETAPDQNEASEAEKPSRGQKAQKKADQKASKKDWAAKGEVKGPVRIRVLKSKNRRALILVPEKAAPLEPGIYVLNKAGSAEHDTELPKEVRDHSFSATISTDLFKQVNTASGTKTSTDLKSFDADVTFGWNFKYLEAGPFIDYSFSTVGQIDSKTLLGGLFVDLNLFANAEENIAVPGVRLEGGAGQEDNSAYATAYTVTMFQAGIFVKYFGLGSNFAITPEVAFRSLSGGTNGSKTTTTGPLARLGIVSYF
jgi:hypothetical protein